jgi:hypothetical protein
MGLRPHFCFMGNVKQNGNKTVGTFPNKATQFSKEYQPVSNGRPKGSISLETRVRRWLEGDEELPLPIKKAIQNQVGADKNALDAIIIVGILQALQGDKGWAELVLNRGHGKVPDKTEHSGSIEIPDNRKGVIQRLIDRNKADKT